MSQPNQGARVGISVSAGTPGQSILTQAFGELPDGTRIEVARLTNRHGLTLEVLTLGATLHRLVLPGGSNVAAGHDTLAGYLADPEAIGAGPSGAVWKFGGIVAGPDGCAITLRLDAPGGNAQEVRFGLGNDNALEVECSAGGWRACWNLSGGDTQAMDLEVLPDSGARGELRPVARLRDPASGAEIELLSDQPAVLAHACGSGVVLGTGDTAQASKAIYRFAEGR